MNVCRASASAGSTQQSLQWYVKMCSVFLPGTWVCLLLMLSHLSPSHRMHCAYLWIYAYFITTPQMAGHKCIAVEVAEVLLRRFLRFKMTNFYAHYNWVVLDFQGGGLHLKWNGRFSVICDVVGHSFWPMRSVDVPKMDSPSVLESIQKCKITHTFGTICWIIDRFGGWCNDNKNRLQQHQ